MAFLSIPNIEIKGISACVPGKISNNKDLSFFSQSECENFIKTTGVERRRISEKHICSSDLCYEAANRLIEDLKWERESIECLIFVSQSPDYILPATSLILQEKLKLSSGCYTLDISLGCSGWVYGMSVISSLLSSGTIKRGLLLAGDTVSKYCLFEDKSTYPLFGDAGTATAVEYNKNANEMYFHLSSDGKGEDAIKIKNGGCRNLFSSGANTDMPNADSKLYLDGMNVFAFGISKAPESTNCLLEHFSLVKDNIDYFIFHQANLFMNEKIRKKLKLPVEKTPYSLKNFGNTSCATIPLTMVTEMQNALKNKRLSNIACGFGVGLSWGSTYFETNKIVCSDLIEL